MGVSTRRALVRRFGKPDYERTESDGLVHAGYRDIGSVPGEFDFVLKPPGLTVLEIGVRPREFRLADLERIYGQRHVETSWSIADCLGDLESSPIYIDPKGWVVQWEYRELGITFRLVGARVEELRYSGRPAGLDRNPCRRRR